MQTTSAHMLLVWQNWIRMIIFRLKWMYKLLVSPATMAFKIIQKIRFVLFSLDEEYCRNREITLTTPASNRYGTWSTRSIAAWRHYWMLHFSVLYTRILLCIFWSCYMAPTWKSWKIWKSLLLLDHNWTPTYRYKWTIVLWKKRVNDSSCVSSVNRFCRITSVGWLRYVVGSLNNSLRR